MCTFGVLVGYMGTQKIGPRPRTRPLVCVCLHMRTCHAKLRYFDWDGQVHLGRGKTGVQEGDTLEMIVFHLHLWGRTLPKSPQDRWLTYTDDGYI